VARRIRDLSTVPLLRKEFFTSPIQMDESADVGFDAVQLTLSTIPDLDLALAMKKRAESLGLEVVVCVHSARQLHDAMILGAEMIGVANRDITALELDSGTVALTEQLISDIPEDVYTISESSLLNREDVVKAAEAGADAVLVGTAIAKSDDPTGMIRAFRTQS
jgi:indole-3-glycerol phosphate synthase